MASTRDPLATVPPPYRPSLDWTLGDGVVGFLADTPEGWTLSGVLVRSGSGQLVLKKLTVSESSGSGDCEITARALRGLPLTRVLGMVRARIFHQERTRLRAKSDGREFTEWHDFGVQLGSAARASEAARRGGRKGYDDAFYERIALAYLKLINLGQAQQIYIALAKQERRRTGTYVAPETVRAWVNRAVKDGYLVRGQRGRAIARPGPRLRQHLEGTGTDG